MTIEVVHRFSSLKGETFKENPGSADALPGVRRADGQRAWKVPGGISTI
jgi:hypothetical protein